MEDTTTTSTSTSRTLEAALGYVNLGLPIIPLCSSKHQGMSFSHREGCESPGKTPVIKEWQKRGVPQQEEVEGWFSRNPHLNLGLILGRAGEEQGWNICGIDVDGEEAEERLQKLSRGVLPPTWEFTTARGRRLLYMLPEGAHSKKLKQTVKEGEVAFLATGQQTVIPPSVHYTGKLYQWKEGRDPSGIGLADAPQWLLNVVLIAGGEEGEPLSPPIEYQDWNRTLTEGERNTHITKLAGSLIARDNIPKRDVISFLRTWNREHCDPPISEVEIEAMVTALFASEKHKQIARKGKNKKEEAVLRPVPFAEAFLDKQKEQGYSWKYSTTRGMFYRCDDSTGPWQPLDSIFLQKLIRQQLVHEDPSWDKMYCVNEILGALKEIMASEEEINLFDMGAYTDLTYVFLENGMLDWKRGVVVPWDPKTYSTIQLPVIWNPKEAESGESKSLQVWEEVLNEWISDKDTIAFLQEYLGYCLLPDCSFRTAIFLFGAGSNGKSLFLDVITKLFGRYISFIPLHRIAERFETVGLLDKLINVCGDIDPKYIKETSILKAAISGDVIRGEYKYGKSFHFTPTSKMIFSANTLPRSQDTTYGWYSRWKYIEFPHRFPVNPGFKANLLNTLATPEALSALLWWAVEGLKRLYANGVFTDSHTMKAAGTTYRTENDSVLAFTEMMISPIELENTLPHERPTPIIIASLYRVYTEWCEDQGLKATSQIGFSRRLMDTGNYVKAVRLLDSRSTSCLINVKLSPEIEKEYKMLEALRKQR
ncbi:MAG: hypothetical protein DDT19_00691 [Syntrophomonadaceae bacterium]|nr:hypothetical protein [Bacillota bacterium]